MLERVWRKENLLHSWVGMQVSVAAMENSMGNSLAVQHLGLHALTAEGPGSILVLETKPHKPPAKRKNHSSVETPEETKSVM